MFFLEHAPACTIIRRGNHDAFEVTDEDDPPHGTAIEPKFVRYRPQRWERHWRRVPVRDLNFDAFDTWEPP